GDRPRRRGQGGQEQPRDHRSSRPIEQGIGPGGRLHLHGRLVDRAEHAASATQVIAAALRRLGERSAVGVDRWVYAASLSRRRMARGTTNDPETLVARARIEALESYRERYAAPSYIAEPTQFFQAPDQVVP